MHVLFKLYDQAFFYLYIDHLLCRPFVYLRLLIALSYRWTVDTYLKMMYKIIDAFVHLYFNSRIWFEIEVQNELICKLR